ncbi:MAG TPA: amidase [Candidatus Dormibacteraeota bacterium]|nr:amidase [Candidatus Dormibacteraeota bacterium]
MSLHYRSLLEVSGLMRAKELSPVELAREMLERIERLNPSLGAYYTVFAESALAEARAAESEIATGAWRGPLHGVPIAFKDLFQLGPTTAGSGLLAGHVASRDAELVTRARAAGAVILGKLATHEFGLAAATLSDHFPPARNPWDPERTPGGSSTGAGTALAAGLAFGAFGTDTGGSVRLPAAFSGVVGFKPTFGLLGTKGVIPLSPTLDHAGPLARRVADAAALGAIAFDADAGLHGLRVGVPRDFWNAGDPQVRERVEAAIDSLPELGALISEVSLGFGVVQVMATGYLITLPEAAAFHLPALRSGRSGYGHEFGLVMRTGLLVPGHSYVHAQKARARISRRMAEVFESFDVLAMPTVGAFADPLPAGPRPLTKRISEQPTPQYTWLANVYGGPAVSVPCGFTAEGLPVGLQLMGRPADDATVLRAAHAYEQAAGWRDEHPPLWP